MQVSNNVQVSMDKTTTIKSLAIMGVKLRGSLKPIEIQNSMASTDSKGSLNLAAIMPRGVHLSDSQCIFFQTQWNQLKSTDLK